MTRDGTPSKAGLLTLLRLLLLAALVVPVGFFAIIAAQSRTQALQQADTEAERTTRILHGHAQKVFEAYDLLLDRIEDRIAGLDWDSVQSSPELAAFLRDLDHKFPAVGSVFLIDAQGDVRASSIAIPAGGTNVADRDYMVALREGRRGTFVSETIRGRITGTTAFNVARLLHDASGKPRGVITVAAFPAHFSEFYRATAPGLNYSAGLVRADGMFLVRDAEVRPSREQPLASENFRRAVQQSDHGSWLGISSNDGYERLVHFRRLDGYPVFVLFALGTEAVIAEWRRQLIPYAVFTLAATVFLAAMAGLALARTRQEQAARRQLEEEVRRRAETESKLARAQKLEAIGQLSAGVAHDFNNLLQILLGNLEMLRRANEERRPRLIDNALRAVEQGRRITGQLLAFGRRQSLRPEVLDLNTLIASMDDMLAQSLRGDIRIELDLGDDLWPVEVDPSQFQVALINLAANARDAMPKGGRFRIATQNTVMHEHGPAEGVAVSVSDTGLGMSREVLARVGEPFFSTKKAEKQGTGLGLAQVLGFVQQSGGSVDIKSELDRGTTVTLHLPRAELQPSAAGPPRPAAHPAAVARAASPGTGRVLVVEDNPQVADVATTILREAGHVVTRAASGDEALELLRQARGGFEVVFSDLVMPGITGLELARQVRDAYPETAIVLATGYSDAAADAEQEGYALLSKPYAPQHLIEAVEAALARAQAGAGNVVPLKRGS